MMFRRASSSPGLEERAQRSRVGLLVALPRQDAASSARSMDPSEGHMGCLQRQSGTNGLPRTGDDDDPTLRVTEVNAFRDFPSAHSQ
jgi:hypothetical protein